MINFKILFTMALLLPLPISASAEERSCVDTALVLAIDGSGSISNQEYAFQKQAIALALLDRDVVSALKRAGTVALSAVFWGDGEFSGQKLGWHVVIDGKGAEALAEEMLRNQRVVFGDTGIGSGVWSALDLLSDPKLCATRSIINVSGDGKETISPKRRELASLYNARRRAREMAVTINALVISREVPDLAAYYASQVIIGDDAFVMDIVEFDDFSSAIKRKLIRELSPAVAARLALNEN
jgi:hypothetical protein